VCADLGLSTATATKWKIGSTPRSTTLQQIAEYFDVSVSYFNHEIEETTTPSIEPNAVFLDDKRVYMIPMYESVSAGFGASAINEVVGYEPCHIPNPADAAESLCIRVSGDSMFPKIEDGDIIQVHKQTSVDSGSIAVVLLDNEEGLVKKVLYGDDWIELHSINPMYPIQRFDGKDVLRIKVVGLVKAIIKRL
jgi:repressor LexA